MTESSPAIETIASPAKKIKIETVETVKRQYEIEAPDREVAVKRLRLFWADPESLRDGLVTRLAEEETTSRQVRVDDKKVAPR